MDCKHYLASDEGIDGALFKENLTSLISLVYSAVD